MKYNDMHMCGLTLLRAVKRPLRGGEGSTFWFIKIESWNLERMYARVWQLPPLFAKNLIIVVGPAPIRF